MLFEVQHNLDDLYLMLAQMKTELKPIERTFVEKYGVIIGALFSVITPLIIFYLTKNKESKKDEKAIRSKIFSDVMEFHYDFIETVKARDLKLVDVRHSENRLLIYHKEPDISGLTHSLAYQMEQLQELEIKLNEIKKKYFARVFNYMFHKENNTVVTGLQKELRGVGLKFKTDAYESSDEAYCKEHYNMQIWKCNTFYSENVLQPSGQIIDSILKNK